MFIELRFSNWMSFRDEQVFSMVPSLERQHIGTLSRIRRAPHRVLPVAAIYGPNASGKSNFYAALRFIRNAVLFSGPGNLPTGTGTIENLSQYRLDDAMMGGTVQVRGFVSGQ